MCKVVCRMDEMIEVKNYSNAEGVLKFSRIVIL
jgi:hypothetical protein